MQLLVWHFVKNNDGPKRNEYLGSIQLRVMPDRI